MKKMVFLISILTLILMAWATPAYVAEKSPYKIGVNLEFTGPWAEVTKLLKSAMMLEVEKITRRAALTDILSSWSSKTMVSMSEGWASNITKFTRDKEILAVIGPFEDNLQGASRAIAEREKITNLIICPSEPDDAEPEQKWAFNIAQSDTIVSQKLVDLSLARKYKKGAGFPWRMAPGPKPGSAL